MLSQSRNKKVKEEKLRNELESIDITIIEVKRTVCSCREFNKSINQFNVRMKRKETSEIFQKKVTHYVFIIQRR